MSVKVGFLRIAVAVAAVGAVAGAMTIGCTTDPNDPGAAVVTGSGGMTGGGTGSMLGTATGGAGGAVVGPTGTACASHITIPAGSPVIADFDGYDGVSDIGKWSFPLGDSATGAYAGPFGYGDRASGFPETFDMVAGQSSKYALRIADTLAQSYGGGMGTWLSACVSATQFAGISFWVRGHTPMAKATLTLSMQETLPSVPAKPTDPIGTCAGTATTCVHPTYLFDVTDTWTKVQVPWASFMPGNAAGTAVTPDGHNITQVQFGVALVWAADANGVYAPTPAPYELVVDTMSFY
jgi:hypothetical protein